MIEFTDYGTFADALDDESAVVRFANKAEETTYERLDSQLIEHIKEAYTAFGIRDGIHHIEDWWPNHLRGVESDPIHFRADLLRRLQALLRGEFAPWRIVPASADGVLGVALTRSPYRRSNASN